MKEFLKVAERMYAGFKCRISHNEVVTLGRASLLVKHKRPQDFKRVDPKSEEDLLALIAKGAKKLSSGLWLPDLASYTLMDDPELVWNQKTDAGIDFLHQQGYQTSGLGTNGLNYGALTNTNVSPAHGDTTLSGEITTNGLARAQMTVAHSAGTTTTTLDHTWTCATAPQAAQAFAVFTAASVGIMNHELNFTQRSLQIGDTLDATLTVTLS